MPTIDDKVVAMSFESSKFEQGVSKSITALDKLKAALRFDHAGQGLEDVGKAANNLNLGHIGGAVDGISRKLEALRLVAIGVMSQIATQAVRTGATFVKSLTLDPIKLGFQEYATNLNAVQTILANTQAAGTDLKDVNAALDELNEFSDKTIYNFSQMARNIGTFTAAGVDLDTATGAIKGIANLAALSGSNSEQASTAMYQLSQAISAGRVSLMDWNSVVNAGMGGTVFQRALAQTAESMGTLKKGAVDLTGPMKNVSINGESFRQSLSAAGAGGTDSWLTSKVLTETLKQFTGDLNDAELAAMGFNEAEIKSIQQTAKTALEAATQVKTLGQLFEVTKETAGSGWAETWEIIFGDFEEAKTLFTNVSNVIGDFVKQSAHSRNAILTHWKNLGGRTKLIAAIGNVFRGLMRILEPIKEAFHDIFPPVTGKLLADLTDRFLRFSHTVSPMKETVENLKRTFRGIFAVFSIVGQIVSGLFGVFRDLFGELSKGTGGFLEFTAGIGDWLVGLDEALKKGDGLKNFFEGLTDILKEPIEVLGVLKDSLSDVFSGFSSGGVSGEMSVMSKILEVLSAAWANFIDAFGNADKVIKVVLDSLVAGFETLGPAIGDALGNMNFDALLQVVQTGLFAGLVIMFKRFFGKGSAINQITKGFGGGIIRNISGSFRALEGSMVALQNNIKAGTLMKIAIAIGILTASVVALSFVDPEDLTKALTAMTIGFGQLLGAMAILTAVGKTTGFIKIPLIAASLILLAGAILILSAAVVILSQLDWNELLKGLVGVGVLLGIIVVAAIPLSASSGGMIRAGVGIMAIAVALLTLSIALQIMARLSLTDLAQGLVAFGGALAGIVFAMKKMPPSKGMIAQAGALLILALALNAIAIAVQIMARMSLQQIAQGLIGLGLALGGLILALKFMGKNPKQLIAQAGALLILAAALNGIAIAVQIMGRMSMQDLAQGLIALGIALAMMAGALAIMGSNIHGAIALGVAAAAISVLVPALVTLGQLSWQQIVTALIGLAGALAIIGAAGALIAPVVLPLLGLGAALFLIGAGVALIGVGLGLIATGLSALVVALPTGAGVILAAFVEFQKGMIENIKLLIEGILEIVKGVAEVAPELVTAFVDILNSVIDGLIQAMPKLLELFQTIIDAILQLLADNQDSIILAGWNLLIALLQGIRDHIAEITTLVVDIISNFINAVANNIEPIVTAGLNLLVALINGISSGIGRLIVAAGNLIVRFITGLSSQYGKIITAGTNAVIKLIEGIGNAAGRVATAAVTTAGNFIRKLAAEIVRLVDVGVQAFIDFLNGVADIIETRSADIGAAMGRIGAALITGLADAIRAGRGEIEQAFIDAIPGGSKVRAGLGKIGIDIGGGGGGGQAESIDAGSNAMQGFVQGFESEVPAAVRSMNQTLSAISNAVTSEIDASPTITPILDLTQVRGQVQELTRLTDITPIAAAASLRAASAISATRVSSEEAAVAPGGTSVNFEQNNYSPTALSESEIYRRTRNQLSQVKIALDFT